MSPVVIIEDNFAVLALRLFDTVSIGFCQAVCQRVFLTLQSADDGLKPVESIYVDAVLFVFELGHALLVLRDEVLKHLALGTQVVLLLKVGRHSTTNLFCVLPEAQRGYGLLNLAQRRSDAEHDGRARIAAETRLQNFCQR